jgi:hypothetical protein
LMALLLGACSHDRHHRHPYPDDAGYRYPSKRARVKSEAKYFGYRTERAFRKVGGKLEKFFTGHDTISE